MARQRLLKPEFFTDAKVAELVETHGFGAALLFAGLWGHADREGRLLDDPADLRMRLPLLSCGTPVDFKGALARMVELGMLKRYQAKDGRRCLLVSNFKRHQQPNVREAESKLDPDEHGSSTVPSPDLHRESTVKAPDKHRARTFGNGNGDGDGDGSGGNNTVELGARPVAPSKRNGHANGHDTSVAAVAEVFEHWQKVLAHPRAKLDAKVRRCVVGALKLHSVADLKLAIDGCKLSPFHMGKNDRNRPFDALTLICRDAEHVEQFIGYVSKPPTGTARLHVMTAEEREHLYDDDKSSRIRCPPDPADRQRRPLAAVDRATPRAPASRLQLISAALTTLGTPDPKGPTQFMSAVKARLAALLDFDPPVALVAEAMRAAGAVPAGGMAWSGWRWHDTHEATAH